MDEERRPEQGLVYYGEKRSRKGYILDLTATKHMSTLLRIITCYSLECWVVLVQRYLGRAPHWGRHIPGSIAQVSSIKKRLA